ncbi:MAG: GNAT family N-acetyltransferase [Clostridia bacterium]|nr:GNAT family N-acetyltransferase [Clostridia bacterium]
MIEIIEMKDTHAEAVIEMMRTFYASDAVSTNGSEEIFRADVGNCINGSPYLEGYVFADGDRLVGYGMIAKSFSTEFGRRCIWIEDIYIIPEYRSQGLGTEFLRFVEQKFPGALLRLEAEVENAHALHTYHKNGFTELPYTELMKMV